MIRQLLQPLYATAQYRLTQFPDLHAYVQTHRKTANYDLDGVTTKLADAEDFQRVAATVEKFRDGSRIAERTGRGDVCVVVYKHGALGHIKWIALSLLPVWGGYTVHLASDEAYSYDSFTVPAFRRQGLASEARVFQMTYLAQHGVRCLYSDSRLDNINTQRRWMERIREGRQRLLGMVTVTTVLGWTRCTFAAETPAMRLLLARLYHVLLQRVQIRPMLPLLEKIR